LLSNTETEDEADPKGLLCCCCSGSRPPTSRLSAPSLSAVIVDPVIIEDVAELKEAAEGVFRRSWNRPLTGAKDALTPSAAAADPAVAAEAEEEEEEAATPGCLFEDERISPLFVIILWDFFDEEEEEEAELTWKEERFF